MKTARLVTLIGSIALFITSCLHSMYYSSILERAQKEALHPETAAILKTCWLTLSVTLLSLAVIAFLARSSPRGGAVVLISGLAVAACGGLMLSFLGRFIGVYMLTLDAALLVVGGGLQLKASPAS